MGIIGKFVKFNGLLFATGAGVTMYQYPELRREPGQIFKATMRSLRCAKAGMLMAREYMSVSIKYQIKGMFYFSARRLTLKFI